MEPWEQSELILIERMLAKHEASGGDSTCDDEPDSVVPVPLKPRPYLGSSAIALPEPDESDDH